MLRKNVAGQFVHIAAINATTGAALTGATISMRRCLDGTFAAGGATITEDTGTGFYKVALAQADTNGNNIGYFFTATNMIPIALNVITTAADPTDSVRFGLTALPNAAAAASGGLHINGSNSGTTTYAALTVTGALTISDGMIVTASTTNRSAISATGNGTGHGAAFASGGGATGNGLNLTSSSTAGNGLYAQGITAGLYAYSSTGTGMLCETGGSGQHGFLADGASGTNSHGFGARAGGSAAGIRGFNQSGSGPGARLTGGTTGNGFDIIGGGTSGNGLNVTTTSGHGVNLAPVGTSKHGLFITGGNGGTSDGISLVAGTGGVPFRGNITGDITGTITTATNVTTVNGLAANVITAAATATDFGAEIADAVWDEAISGHLGAGSTGAALNGAGAAGDPWTTPLPGAYGAGTAGYIVGTNLDATVSSRSSYAGGDTSGTTTLLSRLTSTRAGYLDNLSAGAVALEATVQAILADTGTDGVVLSTATQRAIADELLGRNVSGGSSTGRTVKQALHFIRNKWVVSGGTLTVYDTDDTTSSWTSSVTGTAGADPVTGSDPA